MAARMGSAQIQQLLPLFGVGVSLGGTILLYACLGARLQTAPQLGGLVCTSSSLDLGACSRSVDRPRNRPYQAFSCCGI